MITLIETIFSPNSAFAENCLWNNLRTDIMLYCYRSQVVKKEINAKNMKYESPTHSHGRDINGVILSIILITEEECL